MLQTNDITLPHGSKLKKVSEGQKLNWIFLPGGPGLGEEYFEDLFKEKFLLGNVYLYKFPKYEAIANYELFYLALQKDISDIIQYLKNSILVGHSFSGMLLQTLSIPSSKNCKLVLLNSSPSLDCFESAKNALLDFSKSEQKIIAKTEQNYAFKKTNQNFIEMLKAWSPYYVNRKNKTEYYKMLSACSVDYQFYEWGRNYFFEKFVKIGKIPKDSIIINSSKDKICPSHLYKNYDLTENWLVSLDLSSHFPWLENKPIFNQALIEVEKKILSNET